MAMAEHRGGVIEYGSDWLAATLLPHLDRLQPFLDPGRAPAQSHLRDALHACARNGFSIIASARALRIHPNTVKYRLDRRQELTGWDPRTPGWPAPVDAKWVTP
jgi:DNA-binding PucR family transcriptional regulator